MMLLNILCWLLEVRELVVEQEIKFYLDAIISTKALYSFKSASGVNYGGSHGASTSNVST